jgi:hypothetical protein
MFADFSIQIEQIKERGGENRSFGTKFSRPFIKMKGRPGFAAFICQNVT